MWARSRGCSGIGAEGLIVARCIHALRGTHRGGKSHTCFADHQCFHWARTPGDGHRFGIGQTVQAYV